MWFDRADHNEKTYIDLCYIEIPEIRYDVVVNDKKAYAEAYFHLGNLYLMTGKQASGLESYNKAIANGFDDSQIFFNLGLMYEEDGNDELAIRNYTKAILKDPLRVDARVRKAKIFISNGKQQEALETLDELILADPDANF